jgi:site-specific DNA recombinase
MIDTISLPPRSCIENILNDTFYYGMAQSKKHASYPHKYECLITKDLYDKCKEVKEGKRTNIPKFLSKDFIFKGMLHCKNCGCLMTPQMKKKPSGLVFIYYSCTNSKGLCKRVYYVPESTLLKPVYAVFERFSNITEEDQEYIVNKLRSSTEAEAVFHKNQIARIRTEYDNIKRREENLLEAFLDKSITKDIYDKKHQEYHDKAQLLKMELDEHDQGNYDYQTTVASVFSVARRAKEIFESSEPHEKRAFLNYLLQNPVVQEKNLEFTIRSPFNLVLNWAESPNRGA